MSFFSSSSQVTRNDQYFILLGEFTFWLKGLFELRFAFQYHLSFFTRTISYICSNGTYWKKKGADFNKTREMKFHYNNYVNKVADTLVPPDLRKNLPVL